MDSAIHSLFIAHTVYCYLLNQLIGKLINVGSEQPEDKGELNEQSLTHTS
jgi:hypothetical protein